MISVLYRLARLDQWSGKYHFTGYTLDQGGMQGYAHEIYSRVSYFEKPYTPDWLVLGASSLDGLERMLKRLNDGKTSASARLSRFLAGAMDEEMVKGIEDDIARDEPRDYYLASGSTYTRNFTPNLQQWGDEARDAVRRALNDMYGVSNLEPTPDPTEPPHPTSEVKEAPPEKPVRWPKEVKNRLKLMKYLIERGVYDDDLVTESV